MAPAAVLTIGLQTVRAEFNDVFPDRLKASDGWIGDLAHQMETASGHNPDITGNAEWKDGDKLNEVRAIDVTKELNDRSGHNVTMETVVQYLVRRGQRGIWLPFDYIIYQRRIWAAGWGWTQRTYTGSNPHDHHAHFSGGRSQAADNWTGSLGLATLTGGDMALSQEDKDWMLANLGPQPTASKIGRDLGTKGSGIYDYTVARVTEGTKAGFASVVAAISALDTVDEQKLAAALAPAIGQQVLAGLPDGTVTKDDVVEAVKDALRQGVGQ